MEIITKHFVTDCKTKILKFTIIIIKQCVNIVYSLKIKTSALDQSILIKKGFIFMALIL